MGTEDCSRHQFRYVHNHDRGETSTSLTNYSFNYSKGFQYTDSLYPQEFSRGEIPVGSLIYRFLMTTEVRVSLLRLVRPLSVLKTG